MYLQILNGFHRRIVPLTIDSILRTIYDLTDPFEEIIGVSLCKAPKYFDEAKEEL